MHKRLIIAVISIGVVGLLGWFGFSAIQSHKTQFAVGSLALFEKVSKLLPIEPDTKKEIEVVNTLVQEITLHDDRTRVFLVLLQNNYELRPGGGFLGQYAVIKVKNAEIIATTVEDANLLDQRIKNANIKVTPPWPLTRYAQIKRWMLRDSNFSPDFPYNAQKAEYFYRLGGGHEKFDAVIAVNSDVFNHLLDVTGPITMAGFGTFSSTDGALKLEEAVEKNYLGDDVPAELKQNRKNVMKQIAAEMIKRLNHVDQIQKLAEFAQNELRTKDIMIYFHDTQLQSLVESVHWDGGVATDWNNDYLMVVDANLGALKSDYYVKRSLAYTVDFTGEKPKANVSYTYNHTATTGDWRTSDYHTYARILAPIGSKYIDQSRRHTGGVIGQDSTDLNKTVFGYKVDALMGRALETGIEYELPDTITPENYHLLIQKQSGTGTIPVTVTLKTKEKEYTQSFELKKDLNISIQTTEEQKP
jgi:hypothetical protein